MIVRFLNVANPEPFRIWRNDIGDSAKAIIDTCKNVFAQHYHKKEKNIPAIASEILMKVKQFEPYRSAKYPLRCIIGESDETGWYTCNRYATVLNMEYGFHKIELLEDRFDIVSAIPYDDWTVEKMLKESAAQFRQHQDMHQIAMDLLNVGLPGFIWNFIRYHSDAERPALITFPKKLLQYEVTLTDGSKLIAWPLKLDLDEEQRYQEMRNIHGGR